MEILTPCCFSVIVLLASHDVATVSLMTLLIHMRVALATDYWRISMWLWCKSEFKKQRLSY